MKTRPLQEWIERRNPDRQTRAKIDRWLQSTLAIELALELEGQFEIWLRDRTGQLPDLVRCISLYGMARFLLQGLPIPPIDISAEELEGWHEAGYTMSLREIQERLASVAGGFLQFAGYEPQLTMAEINEQLQIKMAQMEEWANLSIEDHYTPQELTDEELAEGGDLDEQHSFDAPFKLRDELASFEWAMEKYRLFSISQRNEKISLPNRTLYHALTTIDLNKLLAQLKEVDSRLRVILAHLAKCNYFELDSESAPEHFWWRHSKHTKKSPHRRR